jgi:hypothetical protein
MWMLAVVEGDGVDYVVPFGQRGFQFCNLTLESSLREYPDMSHTVVVTADVCRELLRAASDAAVAMHEAAAESAATIRAMAAEQSHVAELHADAFHQLNVTQRDAMQRLDERMRDERARLGREQDALAKTRGELDQEKLELARSRDGLKRDEEAHQARKTHDEERIAAMRASIAQKEAECAQQTQEIQAKWAADNEVARKQIADDQAALARSYQELQTRKQRLVESTKAAETKATSLDQREAAMRVDHDRAMTALRTQEDDLRRQWAALSTQQSQVDVRERDLSAQRRDVDLRRHQLDVDRGLLSAQRRELNSRAQDLSAKRRALETQDRDDAELRHHLEARATVDTERRPLRTKDSTGGRHGRAVFPYSDPEEVDSERQGRRRAHRDHRKRGDHHRSRSEDSSSSSDRGRGRGKHRRHHRSHSVDSSSSSSSRSSSSSSSSSSSTHKKYVATDPEDASSCKKSLAKRSQADLGILSHERATSPYYAPDMYPHEFSSFWVQLFVAEHSTYHAALVSQAMAMLTAAHAIARQEREGSSRKRYAATKVLRLAIEGAFRTLLVIKGVDADGHSKFSDHLLTTYRDPLSKKSVPSLEKARTIIADSQRSRKGGRSRSSSRGERGRQKASQAESTRSQKK